MCFILPIDATENDVVHHLANSTKLENVEGKFVVVSDFAEWTVSGQNTIKKIAIHIIPLALLQHIVQKQNIIRNNQLLKLQLAVTIKMLY